MKIGKSSSLILPSGSNLHTGKSLQTIVLIVSCVLCAGQAGAQVAAPAKPSRSEQVRALNNRVLGWHSEMQRAATPADLALLRSQAEPVIVKRAAALAALIREDPHEALAFAFSPELLADLAAKFPNSASQLERHGVWQGEIEYWIADAPGLNRSWSQIFIKTGQQLHELHFAGPEPAYIKSGETVRIVGVALARNIAVETSAPVESSRSGVSGLGSGTTPADLALLCMAALAVSALRRYRAVPRVLKRVAVCALAFAVLTFSSLGSVAQTAACSATGVQKVAVLLVTFPGVTPPANITPTTVHDMFFSTTGPSLDGYWREASYGQTSATGDVFGWYTLDSSYANCARMDLLRDAAVAAASNAGVPIQSYNRIFVVTTTLGCGWVGMSLGGCTTVNAPTGSFQASASFLDASWQGSEVQGAQNAAHEGGHNLGLGHAQLRTFNTEPLGGLNVAGTLLEYGDHFSDMASSNIGHYAVPHKAEILGWMGSSNYQAIQTSGTYTIAPLELSTAAPQGLKVQRGTGNAGYYLWIEYRQPVGSYDSTLAPAPQSGALIHYEDPTTGGRTQLLDFTPQTTSMADAALLPGATWSDPYSDLSVTVVSATATGLSVNVSYSGTVPCTHANPSLSVTPLNPSTYAGTGTAYTVSAVNNDSAGCSATTYALSSSQPAGWTSALSQGSLSLSPGQSGTFTMAQTPPSGTAPGTYPVSVSASNLSSVGSAAANLTVMAAPAMTVSLSVSATSYTRRGSVGLTATVKNGSSPVSGASVTFAMTLPNGSVVKQVATTNRKGIASWSYKLSQQSPSGTYSATAQATYSSGTDVQSATSNTVTFSVN